MRLFKPVPLAMSLAMVVGCQRLPEPDDAPMGAGSDESGTTFLPGEDDSDGSSDADGDGDSGGSTGEPLPPETIECIEGLSIAGEQVESPADLAGVQIVEGSLALDGIRDVDLGWMPCLRQVEGELDIANSPDLTSLDGLESLESVGETLSIRINANLLDVDGLSGLENVGSIDVRYNDSLTNVDGLRQVQTSDRVQFVENHALTSIRFDEITQLQQLLVMNHTALTEVELPLATEIAWLDLTHCPALPTLDGLSALEHTVTLELRTLTGLMSVDGLGSLREVDVRASFINLDSLTELTLPSFERTIGLIVSQSPALTTIELPALVELPEMGLFSLPALEQLPTLPASSGLHSFGLVSLPLISSLGPLSLDPAVVQALNFEDLPALNDLSALSGVDAFEGDVTLHNLPALTSLEALAGVNEFQRKLNLIELPQLTSLTGLDEVQSITSRLTIRELSGLTSMAGLNALTYAGGLNIESNAQLTSLDGLDAVEQTTTLRLNHNPALTDIDAIWPTPVGVLQVNDGDVQIANNPSLSQCTVTEFVQALLDAGWLGMFEVYGNLACR